MGGSTLSGMLFRYTRCIYESKFAEQSRGQFYCEPATGLSSRNDMTLVCNTIKFIVCNSQREEKDCVNDYDNFGEGLIWAIAMLIYSVNQQNRFKTTDFCSYLLSLNEKDDESKMSQNKKSNRTTILPLSKRAESFINLSKRFKHAYETAMLVLEKHYKPPNRFIEIENEDGKIEWAEDDYGQIFETSKEF
ncbi:Cytoplasmic FMR1-interacting protein 1, variant 2 [Bonamia ostreae]|uniref:Cytoplasmic FMR1-interacting protein 1, variant 2 n=1 Tax=Bonamia ostreae TaxID=126728 RepID=A0ABV2AT64_9EUKA